MAKTKEIKTFEIRDNGTTKEVFINGEKLDVSGVVKMTIEMEPGYINIKTIKNEYFFFTNERFKKEND